jgi:hypothetical protein
MKHTKRELDQKITLKEHLLKAHFSLILLLALITVIDLHIKLRCTAVVVEDHEKPLVEVMIFRKLGPATPEVHLATSIIPHLHFIGSSSPRVLAKNCFTKLPPIHEFGEFQRHTLNLTALSVGDAEEGVNLGRRRRRSITWSSARTWSSSRYLGLVFTPHRAARAPFHRYGWRGHCRGVFRFVLTAARTAATSFLHLHRGVQICTTSIRHGGSMLGRKTLDEM